MRTLTLSHDVTSFVVGIISHVTAGLQEIGQRRRSSHILYQQLAVLSSAPSFGRSAGLTRGLPTTVPNTFLVLD
jgi:hypothetical protein